MQYDERTSTVAIVKRIKKYESLVHITNRSHLEKLNS